ncbi:hypothetical protein SAMN05660297_03020 [Natronincola peptidivorans]|uniref:Uncharacterized protein n=1 Tax=Natronincola peptidivorans TaxID=426128 RepID=A0A1I0G148_9FIRM|nr:hypothetical protein [Natronincola peptidivorans]SET64294.1 hypothetical protein SAMN05660297_03020 [Natronincola peptidivorans]
MENKITMTMVLSILTVVAGMILNFQEFLMGSPATIKNLIVTLAYIIIWIFILVISIQSKNHRVIKYLSILWILTSFVSIVTAYVNITGASAYWVIPLAILLLGQWYGIHFFVTSFLTSSIIVASISLVMSMIYIIMIRRTK